MKNKNLITLFFFNCILDIKLHTTNNMDPISNCLMPRFSRHFLIN